MKWITTQYTIEHILELEEKKELELRPDFQRRSVWSLEAKIMLIDSILKDIPMPKIYIHVRTNKKGQEIRAIIDGQQRIKAILEFVFNYFNLSKPYNGEYSNLFYKDFNAELNDKFINYKIDVNEIYTDSEKTVREIYSRVNKYTVALNQQELRKADFPGDFLRLSEQLSTHEFFDEAKIFTAANRRRMTDVEYVSELLASLIDGPQDKKSTLNSFYIDYSKWDKSQMKETRDKFESILSDFLLIFNKSGTPIHKTRFRQKSDFYSLFIAIHELKSEGHGLENKDINFLLGDLRILDEYIAPESEIELFSEYAIKCTSQANTIGSRKWRKDFLKMILGGTYIGRYPSEEVVQKIHYILWDLYTIGDQWGCPPYLKKCMICSSNLQDYKEENVQLIWLPSSRVYQISNAIFVHRSCFEEKGAPDDITIELPFDKK